MMRTKEVPAQHAEGVLIQLNLVFRQVLPKKVPHQLTSSPTRLNVAVVERLWMGGLQQIVELGTIRIRQTNQMACRVHSGRAREIAVSALLTKMLLPLSSRFLAEAGNPNRRGQVNHCRSLMT